MIQSYRTNSEQSINSCANTAPRLCRGVVPLGFIIPSQAHTEKPIQFYSPDLSSWKGKLFIDPIASSSRNYDEYISKKKYAKLRCELNSDFDFRKKWLQDNTVQTPKNQGFMINRYRSGEMTGSFYTTGLETRIIPPIQYGSRYTTKFTKKSQVKMKRAIDHSITDKTFLKYFCTLTFAPSLLLPWQINDDGTVRHDYAKHKLKNFLKALGMKKKRLGKILDYIWAAEIQSETGNIHFHIMWNEFFDIKYLTKLWGQANNSVDIRKTNNPEHSVRYMMKYITKDEKTEIQGNRYYITENLREKMKPNTEILVEPNSTEERRLALKDARQFLSEIKEYAESRGGKILDFGFSLPMPKSNRPYYDKKKKMWIKPNNCDPRLHKEIFSELYKICDIKPF